MSEKNNPTEAKTKAAKLENNEVAGNEGKFVVPEGGENRIWVRITPVAMYDPQSGEKIAKPFLQSFDKGEYKMIKENRTLLGEIFEELYIPE